MTIQQQIEQILAKFGADSVERLRANHIAAGQKASGRTLAAFAYNVAVNGYDVAMQVTGPEYTGALDKGRKPTTQSGGGVLVDRIKQWITDKGVFGALNDKEQTSLAYAISTKIHKSGTYQYRTGRTFNGATNPVSSAFDKAQIQKLVAEISFAIMPTITSEIINQYKK